MVRCLPRVVEIISTSMSAAIPGTSKTSDTTCLLVYDLVYGEVILTYLPFVNIIKVVAILYILFKGSNTL